MSLARSNRPLLRHLSLTEYQFAIILPSSTPKIIVKRKESWNYVHKSTADIEEITGTKELTRYAKREKRSTLAMPPAGGSALIGRFNDTSPIGSFETDKEQANEANSKDVLVFSWNFSNETTAVLPRWTEIFFPWEIVTKLQKRRRSTKKQTGARKSRDFLDTGWWWIG